MRLKYDYLFWDMDGTLMDTQVGVLNAQRYAINKLGLDEKDFSLDRKELFLGPSIPSYLREHVPAFPDERIPEYMAVFREYYAAKGMLECVPYEGIVDLLRDCQSFGYKSWVCTSKYQPAAESIARHFGFFSYLEGIEGAFEGRSEKADIIANLLKKLGISQTRAFSCAMIGDRYTDLLGGAQNQTSTIGVLYGYGKRPELESCRAQIIVDDVNALRRLLLCDETA